MHFLCLSNNLITFGKILKEFEIFKEEIINFLEIWIELVFPVGKSPFSESFLVHTTTFITKGSALLTVFSIKSRGFPFRQKQN